MDEFGRNVALFHDVVLTIIPSDELQDQTAYHNLVEDNGGCFVKYANTFSLTAYPSLTHIISSHIDFPEYEAALEHGIHIVKPSWIIRSIHTRKQAQPRQHSPDPSQFFQDVVLICAELPEGDKDAIIAGVMALGGMYSSNLTKLVTHIVTTSVDHNTVRLAEEKGVKAKVVLPHWFDDCFKLGRMINEGPYMFPDPELLRTGATTRVRDFPATHLEGAIDAKPAGPPLSSPPPSPSKSRKNLNAFQSRKIFLAKDLQLSATHHTTLEGLINHAGGLLVDKASTCDIYVGYYREGKDYITASRTKKIVGNLSWLYHVINRNRFTDPLRKLLHYPVPRDGIPGFENMRISISNYSGDARLYLENLIRYTGATFTKTMKQDNTHLITAHTQSEKCEAAQEWNITVVNHLWLEESYAKCCAQVLSNPRYNHFPVRTNLGEVTGQTAFDAKRLEYVYFPRAPTESPQKPVNPPLSAPATEQVKPSPRKTTSTALSTDFQHLNRDSPTPVFADDDVQEDRPQTTKKSRGRPPKSAATPRLQRDEKENISPLLHSSGRAAKLKAADKLHDQADDIALFQKEMKRKGGVTHGRDRGSSFGATDDSPVVATKQRKKRTSDEMTYDVTAEGSELSDGETQAQTPAKPAAKRAKNNLLPTDLPPVEFRMMVTGENRWIGNPHKESLDRMKLRQLGVLLTQEPKDANILVAPKILRTRKFVSALASAPKVVGTDFLDDALKTAELDRDPPMLHDPESEEKWGFNLAESLERAKVNNRRLLRGWTIFVTRDVAGGFDTYKDIITLNGGNCMLYAGRTGVVIPKRRLSPEEDEDAGAESQHQGGIDELDIVYLVSGNSDAEVKLWKTFQTLAAKQDLRTRIVSSDWLLKAAMSQQIEWNDEWELDANA